MSATTIDTDLLQEIIQAGNELARIVDELRGRSLDTELSRADAVALARWDTAIRRSQHEHA